VGREGQPRSIPPRPCRAVTRLHLDRHQLPVGAGEEQLPAVCPPAWPEAASGRDPPRALRTGEGTDVDLGPTRLVRGVGHPPSIRGEPAVNLDERSAHERPRLGLAGERQHPYVPARLRIPTVIGDEAAGARPVRRPGAGIRRECQQSPLVTAPAHHKSVNNFRQCWNPGFDWVGSRHPITLPIFHLAAQALFVRALRRPMYKSGIRGVGIGRACAADTARAKASTDFTSSTRVSSCQLSRNAKDVIPCVTILRRISLRRMERRGRSHLARRMCSALSAETARLRPRSSRSRGNSARKPPWR